MAATVTMKLREDQVERLQRTARKLGRSVNDAGNLLLEEALRREEFAGIEFRASSVGRQAYVQGSSLAVWEVVMIAQRLALDPQRAAQHLGWPVTQVQAALDYASAYPEEMDAALREQDAVDYSVLSRALPQTVQVVISDLEPATAGSCSAYC